MWGLTDVVDGVLLRHMLGHTSHDVDGVVLAEQLSAQLRVVTDEDARVEVAGEEVAAGVVEERLGEALKAEALVDVAELVCLSSQFALSTQTCKGKWEGERKRSAEKARCASSLSSLSSSRHTYWTTS